MLTWMIYVLVVTLVLTGAALSAERAMRLRRGPTRWIWACAIVASLMISTIIASVSSFQPDEQGHATALVLHQNGMDHTAPRMDDAAAQQIEDALNARVKGQTPMPGSEAALRRLMAGLCEGKPNYEEMDAGLAKATREQLPN